MKNYQEYIFNYLRKIYPESEIRSLVRLLIEEVSGMQASVFLSDKSNQLNELQEKRLDDILHRLANSEPLQYILGETEFYGLPFWVDSRVLIPRPETEELVEWIVDENQSRTIRVLDVGTGSGCIAVALARKLPQAELEAWDVSAGAIEVASSNALRNKVKIDFRECDVMSDQFDIVASYDVIVSNPPYICMSEKGEMHNNVLDYEPDIALFVDDNDPLMFYRRIAELGKRFLKPSGTLFFEINYSFGTEMVELLHSIGYSTVELRQDLSGNDRMVRALL